MSGISPFERFSTAPKASGLYDPSYNKDACGLAMVATLRGTPGHDIIQTALQALRNLDHRGAVGSDEGTGDGAGLLSQMPDKFFRSVLPFELPVVGKYAAGLVFLEKESDERAWLAGFELIAAERSCSIIGTREIPTRKHGSRSHAENHSSISIIRPWRGRHGF